MRWLFVWVVLISSLGACEPIEPVGVGPDGGAFDSAVALDAHRPDAQRMPDAGPPADLDGYVQHFMSAEGIAGVSASIVTREGTMWTGTWGMADIEAGRAVDLDTLFLVASISKTVTSLLVMQLVDDGLLDLDAPLDDYLPFAVRHPTFPGTPITMRMLLTHTSGLHDNFILLGRATYQMDPELSMGEFSQSYLTPGGELYDEGNWAAAPGTTYDYCNAAFGLVGYTVEVLREQSMRAVSQERVFDPLGMATTGWFLADVDLDHLAVPYTYDGRMDVALPQNGFAFYPASSLRVSVTELSLFLRATMRDGELDGMRVLEEATAQASREAQIPAISPSQTITWRYRTVDGERWLAHTGAALGASAIVAYQPDANIGFLVMTNSDAYIQARLGLTDASDAVDAIIDRIAHESRAFR